MPVLGGRVGQLVQLGEERLVAPHVPEDLHLPPSRPPPPHPGSRHPSHRLSESSLIRVVTCPSHHLSEPFLKPSLIRVITRESRDPGRTCRRPCRKTSVCRRLALVVGAWHACVSLRTCSRQTRARMPVAARPRKAPSTPPAAPIRVISGPSPGSRVRVACPSRLSEALVRGAPSRSGRSAGSGCPTCW